MNPTHKAVQKLNEQRYSLLRTLAHEREKATKAADAANAQVAELDAMLGQLTGAVERLEVQKTNGHTPHPPKANGTTIRHKARKAAPAGLVTSRVVAYLEGRPGSTAADVAKALRMSKPLAAQLLFRLIGSGTLKRTGERGRGKKGSSYKYSVV